MVQPFPPSQFQMYMPSQFPHGYSFFPQAAHIPPIMTPPQLPTLQKPASKALLIIDPVSKKPIDPAAKIGTYAKEKSPVKEDVKQEVKPPVVEEPSKDSVVVPADAASSDSGEETIDEKEESSGPKEIFQHILHKGESLDYPEDFPLFCPPFADDEPWKYSNDFLLKFKEYCNKENAETRELMKQCFRQGEERRNSQRKYSNQKSTYTTSSEHNIQPSKPVSKLNQAESPWSNANRLALDENEKQIAEVRSILNKMSSENFEKLSSKIVDTLGVSDKRAEAASENRFEELRIAVIELIFDKAERGTTVLLDVRPALPKIVQIEYKATCDLIEELQNAGLEVSLKKDSSFRIGLVTKCQHEYENKRAWSKRKIEQLQSKAQNQSTPDSDPLVSSKNASTSSKSPKMLAF